MRRITLAPAGCLLLVSGCVTYQPQPLSPEKTAAEWQARALTDPGLRAFAEKTLRRAPDRWPPPAWDLASLTLAAWYFHPDMTAARAKLASAEADARAAGERPDPSFSFSPQYQSNADGLTPWTLGYALDWPIETAGKRAKRVAVSTAQSEVARYDLASAAWKVRSKLRASLLERWAATETVRLNEALLKDQTDLVASLEQRRIAGEIAVTIETEGRIALEQRRLALQEAKKREHLALNELARALGVDASALEGVNIDFLDTSSAPSARDLRDNELRQLALRSRSDVLGALADYAATEATLRLEIAKQYPDVHFGPGYTFDQGAKRWSLGVGVTLPIFSRNRGAIGQAEAARSASAAKFMALQGQIIGDLGAAEAEYRSALETLQVANDSEQRQRAQRSSFEAQFNAGAIGRVEFLSAQLQADDAALARFTALVQAQAALGALEDAVERPLDASGTMVAPRDRLPGVN